MTPFEASTTAQLGTDGRYHCTLDESWNLSPLPQGGVITALAARTMAAALDQPHERLRTLHTTYISQVRHGPLEVDVEVLRRGRSMSHARAEVRNPGTDHGHLTTAVFGTARRGFDFTDLHPPQPVVPVPDCPSFRDPPPPGVTPFPPMPFWDQRVEGRGMMGHAPWEDYVPDRASHATWYRVDDTPRLDDGTVDPLVLVVMSDTMPGAVGEKVGRERRMDWFGPSVDLTFHLLDHPRSEWLLCHNTARYAGDGYASADMAIWDCGPDGRDTPRLVSYATQLFFFTFLDP